MSAWHVFLILSPGVLALCAPDLARWAASRGRGRHLARRPRPLTPFEHAMHGMASRWDATTEKYVSERLR